MLKLINGENIEVKEALNEVTNQHNKISSIVTPKAFVKKVMGLDYVEIGYMKAIADKEFPGWSWEIINSEALGSAAYVVHGRLKWYDNGVMRIGDMVAAHRIQIKKGSSNEFVNVGNDIKSANTDCMKKALNMYMNIADDIYKNQFEDPELTTIQIDQLRVYADEISQSKLETINKLIEDGIINNSNYKGSLAKLKREAKEK
tara:strand:+ start:2195 stop:2800 length:606 start_codon:yes stop_codon:yes gene_type:complete